MIYNELIALFEKRRAALVDTLKTCSSEIDYGKQHQLYGAIKELDLVLETLACHQGLHADGIGFGNPADVKHS